jgi:DNA mismatch repair protein MutL
LILTGRYPIAFLRIKMPPEAVDVNVHPTKLDVRFQDSGRLYSQLLSTLRTKFLTCDLTTRLQTQGSGFGVQGAGQDGLANGPSADPNAALDPQHLRRKQEELVAWAKGELATQVGGGQSAVGSAGDFGNAERKPLELVRIDRPMPVFPPHSPTGSVGNKTASIDPSNSLNQLTETMLSRADTLPTDTVKLCVGPQTDASPPTAYRLPPTSSPVPAMQVHNRYLIAESDDGVVVIDQHALHERILYEQLRERVLAGALETQRLLVPEAVDLSPAEAAGALANQELLAKLGVEVAPFGGDTILVTSYPAMLANFRPAEVLHDLVARLLAEGKAPDRRDLVDELLHMIACRAAIKAGDRLSPEEVSALVELRHLAQDSHHCPHGRPTALVFTREELDRQFLRT